MFSAIITDIELFDEQYQPVSLEGRIKEYLELVLADLKAGHWTKQGGAENALCENVSIYDAEAVRWCLSGLTRKHTNGQKQFLVPLNSHVARSIYQVYRPGLKQFPISDLTVIIVFNDFPTSTVQQMILVVEHAIARLGL